MERLKERTSVYGHKLASSTQLGRAARNRQLSHRGDREKRQPDNHQRTCCLPKASEDSCAASQCRTRANEEFRPLKVELDQSCSLQDLRAETGASSLPLSLCPESRAPSFVVNCPAASASDRTMALTPSHVGGHGGRWARSGRSRWCDSVQGGRSGPRYIHAKGNGSGRE
ncbi:hypothetical protein AOLI_G00130380 [Acnodon oligacanthus]